MITDSTLTPQANLIISEYRRDQAREQWRGWLGWLAAAGVIVALGATIYAVPATRVEAVTQEKDAVVSQKEVLISQADLYASTQLEQCLKGDDKARALEESGACEAAKKLKQVLVNAAPSPVQGRQGTAGRGIANTAIVDGHFQITYTDGITEDKGLIKGEQGLVGRGVSSSTIANGHLILGYSDGVTEDAGQVVGKDGVPGADGAAGQPGRGILSMSQVNDRLLVSYTDGSTADLGPLPSGPKGKDGEPATGWTVYNPDGSIDYTCRRADGFDPANPQYVCPRPSISPSTSPGLPPPTS